MNIFLSVWRRGATMCQYVVREVLFVTFDNNAWL